MCLCFLVFAADSLGRRKSLLWTSIAMSASMLYVGLYVRIEPPVEDAPVPPAGYVALVCIYLFASFFQWGWGPVCWIYVSEIPTARLRGLNVALAAATQWLFNLVIARAVPNMLVTMGEGGYGAFILFASFCGGMFVFTWFLVPETKVNQNPTRGTIEPMANGLLCRACRSSAWTTSSASPSWPRRSRMRRRIMQRRSRPRLRSRSPSRCQAVLHVGSERGEQ